MQAILLYLTVKNRLIAICMAVVSISRTAKAMPDSTENLRHFILMSQVLFASFVYDRNHIVKSINGDRVVITFEGIVVAAMNVKDLILQ